MFRFCGSELDFEIEAVLARSDTGPAIFVGRDDSGRAWIAAEAESNDGGLPFWLCARASERALACLIAGHAEPIDLLRHSFDEAVVVIGDGADRTMRCGELRLLPRSDAAVIATPAASTTTCRGVPVSTAA